VYGCTRLHVTPAWRTERIEGLGLPGAFVLTIDLAELLVVFLERKVEERRDRALARRALYVVTP
jgi:hypothetical protein